MKHILNGVPLNMRTIIALALLSLAGTATGQNIDWIRQFGAAGAVPDRAASVDSSGNIYVVGTTSGVFPGQTSAGGQDIFVRKYDASSTELWTRQFGTASVDLAGGVTVDAGGVYVVGTTSGAFPGYTNAGGQDAFVCKYDTNGNPLWTRQIGTTTTDTAKDVAVDATGVYVAGATP